MESLISYHQEIKGALFVTGFTIGSFLFSMKSVIIKTLKEDVYDQQDYQDKVCQSKALGNELGFYTKLRNFILLLHFAIISSFVSAISQFTLGYFNHISTTIICILFAICSWVVLGVAVYQVGENWKIAIDYSETNAEKTNETKIQKLREINKS